MKKLGFALALVILTGCAVPTTGVQPLSDGLHKIAHQGEGFWVTTESLKIAATKEANDFCARSNKQARVVDVKHIPAGALGRWPEAEVLFRCE